ncbi:MAG TPA: SRPBCC domain-containing protein [Rhizomicrobium sp.]|jgi:uncharacterized protein YndB with AHSA1/START domain|nr:SRPBCC domain-containing protein [Rhizomicrobium sp.]
MTAVKTLTLTRTFDAPRALVFKAFTDQKMLTEWWGPRGFTNPVSEWDARPGGKIKVVMRANDEIAKMMGVRDFPCGGEYVEIAAPERLVFITTATVGSDQRALVNRNTVTFEDQNGKTKLTLHVVVEHAIPEMAGALGGMEQGWSQSLDKLGELLAK